MKILNITDPESFFSALDKCEGEIFLISSEGDRVNLKSKLCQYIALTSMFTEAKIDSLEIEISNPNDLPLIVDYLIRG